MNTSLAYITTTQSFIDPPNAAWQGSLLEPLGYAPDEYRLYFVERTALATQVCVMHVDGIHQGKLVALRHQPSPTEVARLRARLCPLQAKPASELHLVTRVLRKRAVRMGACALVRKFALQITLRPVRADLPAFARVTVDAIGRPRTQLRSLWSLPGERKALAVVSYAAAPLGATKDIVVLLAM